MEIAIASFVKTPGLSPIKTRLGASLGAERAQAFYEACVELTREAMTKAVALTRAPLKIQPYWAVAEAGGVENALWSDFPRVLQGEGSLGARLKRVFEVLKGRHKGVILIGADCPLLSPSDLADAASVVAGAETHVLGPTDDGGYYLFGTKHEVDPKGLVEPSESIWMQVRYSASSTADDFSRQLMSRHERRAVLRLDSRFDVDVIEDLERLKKELSLAKDKWAARVGAALSRI